jgi:hypothetical protein
LDVGQRTIGAGVGVGGQNLQINGVGFCVAAGFLGVRAAGSGHSLTVSGPGAMRCSAEVVVSPRERRDSDTSGYLVRSAVEVGLVLVVALVIECENPPAGDRFAGNAFHYLRRGLRRDDASLHRCAVLH